MIASHTGSHTVLSQIIFNCIADSRLRQTFTIEELIEVFLSQSLTDTKRRVIDQFCDMYAHHGKNDAVVAQELATIIELFGH